jgi:FSR family fosmidomycin resistance protein-like MFS transporter
MLIAWFLLPTASSFYQLIPIFALVGIGASAYHPPAMSMITEMFEESKGKALSINMAIGMFGTAIAGVMFAGVVYLVDTWQNATYVIATAAGLIGLIALFGSINSGMFARINWNDTKTTDGEGLYPEKQTTYGSSANYAFILSPLIFIPILFISVRNSLFRTSTLFTPLLFQDLMALNDTEASIATSIVLGIASLFLLVGGSISDRYLPRTSIIISSVATFVGAFVLVFIAGLGEIWSFGFFYFVLNAGFYIGAPATSSLLADRVKPEQRGKLFGATFSLGQVLGMFTPTIFGSLKDSYGITTAFTLIATLALIALAIGIYIFQEDKTRMQGQMFVPVKIQASID